MYGAVPQVSDARVALIASDPACEFGRSGCVDVVLLGIARFRAPFSNPRTPTSIPPHVQLNCRGSDVVGEQ